jgi:ArsR family transcriptional regulator
MNCSFVDLADLLYESGFLMADSVLTYFQQVASQWDTLRANYFDESVITKALEHAPLDSSCTAVDVGTGTGFVAAGFAVAAGHVIGVDFSDAMLKTARANMDRLGITNVEFKQGTMEALPLGDASADALFANMALHHAPDPLAAVREMARVARPGSRVVITDATRHTFEWFKVEMADVWLGFTCAELERWFAAAGLVDFRYDFVGTR